MTEVKLALPLLQTTEPDGTGVYGEPQPPIVRSRIKEMVDDLNATITTGQGDRLRPIIESAEGALARLVAPHVLRRVIAEVEVHAHEAWRVMHDLRAAVLHGGRPPSVDGMFYPPQRFFIPLPPLAEARVQEGGE